MKRSFFCVFFLIFLTLITCTILGGKIEEEMTLEVIGYQKNASFDVFSMPSDMFFKDNEGSHLYEVYQGTGWESGLRARELFTQNGLLTVDRDMTIARGASRQPIYGELAELYSGKDTAPSTYVAYYPNGIPAENPYLFQVEILEQSEHTLLLYQENGIVPFTENRAKGGLAQLSASDWRLYSLAALEQLLNNVPDCMFAIVMVAAVAVLGIDICILTYDSERNKWLILFNGIVIGILLIILTQILKGIDLPASMLPRENIFSISHYRTELAGIYNALEELGSDTTHTYVVLRDTVLKKGYGILTFGCIAVGIVTIAELSWSLRSTKKKCRCQNGDKES